EDALIGSHANYDAKLYLSGRCNPSTAAYPYTTVFRYSGDDSGSGVHAADPAVVGVGDEEVAVGVQCNARGVIQRSSGGKAAIPAEGKSTIAGDSGNDSSGSIHAADAAVLRVGDEEIAVGIQGDFAREIQPGAGGRTAVAAITAAVITPGPAAGKCGDNPCGSIHAADLIIELVDKKDVSFSVYGDPVGQMVDA